MSEIRVNHGIEAIAFYLNRFIFHGAYSFCKTKKKTRARRFNPQAYCLFSDLSRLYCLHLTMQFRMLDTCLMHYYRLGFKNFFVTYNILLLWRCLKTKDMRVLEFNSKIIKNRIPFLFYWLLNLNGTSFEKCFVKNVILYKSHPCIVPILFLSFFFATFYENEIVTCAPLSSYLTYRFIA